MSLSSRCKKEPIEVRFYATHCDEAGALPCRKWGINICDVVALLVDLLPKAAETAETKGYDR